MATEEKWVNIYDASLHLNFNKETVWRWIKIQDFPSHWAGNLFRFKLSEVDAWVKAGGAADSNKKDSDK